jgi:hypothetical protein
VKLAGHLWFVTGASIVVLVAIVAGLVVMGSPAQIRRVRLDQDRVRDLRNIANEVAVYRRASGNLPRSLAELQQDGRLSYLRLVDSAGGPTYEYRPEGTDAYELCTRFDSASLDPTRREDPEVWNHPAGRHCFRRDFKPGDHR